MKLTLRFVRSTKGTHVYMNSEPDAPISTIYIKREAMTKQPPKLIDIEITTNEEAE